MLFRSLPLIGLGLVHLAVYFDPLSSRLVRHRDRVARLALPVALGFLLVVPLLGLASVRAHGALDPQSLRHARAIHDLEAISEAVEGSGSVEDLQRRLARLRAPALLAADAALPLQRLKIKLGEDLRVARQAINRDLAPPARPSLAHSLRGHLRTALMALVLAVAFVCGSQGRRSLRSPLQEWLVVWSQRRRLAQEQRRIRRVFRQRIRGLQAEQQLLLRAVRFHFRAPGVALPDQPPVDREFVPPDPMQPAPPREQPESA